MTVRPTVFLLMVCFVAVFAFPASAAPLWDNGPINGTMGTFGINSGPQVFDSFIVSGSATALVGLTFGVWLQPGDVLQSASFEMWTGPRRTGTMVAGANVSVTQSNCSTNSAGKVVCLETTAVSNGRALPLGTLWLDIFHVTSQNGDPVGWDINNGVGCTSAGCPSKAVDSAGFSVKSESFQILGGVGAQTPEPTSLALLATGVVGLAGAAKFHQFAKSGSGPGARSFKSSLPDHLFQ